MIAEIQNFLGLVSVGKEWNFFQHSKRNFACPGGHVMFHFSSCIPNEETTWTKVPFIMYGITQSSGDVWR